MMQLVFAGGDAVELLDTFVSGACALDCGAEEDDSLNELEDGSSDKTLDDVSDEVPADSTDDSGDALEDEISESLDGETTSRGGWLMFSSSQPARKTAKAIAMIELVVSALFLKFIFPPFLAVGINGVWVAC